MRDVLGITDGEATSTITGELLDGTPFEDKRNDRGNIEREEMNLIGVDGKVTASDRI